MNRKTFALFLVLLLSITLFACDDPLIEAYASFNPGDVPAFTQVPSATPVPRPTPMMTPQPMPVVIPVPAVTPSPTITPTIVLDWNNQIQSQNPTDGEELAFFLMASESIQSDHPEIIALADEIIVGLEKDYDKARAIHHWMTNNIWYDSDLDAIWLTARHEDIVQYVYALQSLQNRRTVCGGMARLTVALLRASGIPAKKAYGYWIDDENMTMVTEDFFNDERPRYMWAEAFIDGKWIIIDTNRDNWSAYENGVFLPRYPGQTMYFDVSLEDISKELVFDRHQLIRSDNGNIDDENVFGHMTGNIAVDPVTVFHVPHGIATIDSRTFNDIGNNVTTIIVSDTVTTIRTGAFVQLRNVTAVYIPANVTSIGMNIFWNTMIPNITIYGYAGSTAETYARTNNIRFVAGYPVY
jgi:hypothetical protein